MQILNEMLDIIWRYRAKSLLNIIVSYIKINTDNAISLFELANKFNLIEFRSTIYKFISENLISESESINYILSKEKFPNESYELKKILYENYFCSHAVSIRVNIQGIDIKNINQTTISQEKFSEIKKISKQNKLSFCLNCKKIVDL